MIALPQTHNPPAQQPIQTRFPHARRRTPDQERDVRRRNRSRPRYCLGCTLAQTPGKSKWHKTSRYASLLLKIHVQQRQLNHIDFNSLDHVIMSHRTRDQIAGSIDDLEIQVHGA
jgi:hypothetical protein